MSKSNKEPKRKSIPHQKSFAFKEQMRIGGAIAAVLPEYFTQQQVAEHLGISQQMVSRIERQALAKMAFILRTQFRDVRPTRDVDHVYPNDGKTPVVNYETFDYSSRDE